MPILSKGLLGIQESASTLITIVEETTTARTLSTDDQGKLILGNNASTITITVNDDLQVGSVIAFAQTGAGSVTFSASGVTINSSGGNLSIAGQYSSVSLIKTASGVYLLVGDLTT